MCNMRIILASASPRRKELLSGLFEDFEVVPAEGEEKAVHTLPDEIVQELSCQKALEVERRIFSENRQQDYLVVGADTVVAIQGRILGKPRNKADAAAMLSMLSGTTHQVYTGVAFAYSKGGKHKNLSFYERTDVSFYPMSEAEITAYVHTGEPMDKAGGYGIQGIGGRFVEQVRGDYNNVVGLPVARIYQVLKNTEFSAVLS